VTEGPPLPGAAGVAAAFAHRLSASSPAPVAVALSGGGDSVALLRLAAWWTRAHARPLLALTVDHGLNPDSAAWTAFAAARAAESGAAFKALAWEGTKPASGLPAAARAARHALLAQAARRAGATVVLLGHTADDVLESERMGAGEARGIGRLRAWGPSPAWPQGRGLMLLRPMLGVARADLRSWLSARGDPWLDDPANADLRFARVRARSRPDAPTRPAGALDEAAVRALAARAQGAEAGALVLPAAVLEAEAPVAAHLLSVAAVCAGGGTAVPRAAQVERAAQSLCTGAVTGLAGARLERRGDRLHVSREPGERRRNPRPTLDGVEDGRFEAGRSLVLDRFRAACFLVEREPEPADPAQNQRLALNQASGRSVLSTISPRA
jgi:tRNA(Ile)-lysidine synthase